MNARVLTRMSAIVLVAAVARPQDSPRQSPMFTPCAQALSTREFAPLRSAIPDNLRDDAGCLRLDNNRFLLFSQPAGPGNPFRHCDLRAPPPACTQDGSFFYAFETLREFTGANGKRYMLWFNSQMKHGVYVDGYGIFSLVPRSIDPRGFAVYPLAGSTVFRGEGDAPDPCRDLGDHVSEVTGYELLGEGTAHIELRFTSKVTDCMTHAESIEVKSFRPRNGRFEPLTD